MSAKTTYPHFWTDAPAVSWPTYLWRKGLQLFGASPAEPSLLPPSPALPPCAIPSNTSYSVRRMDPAQAADYTDFLSAHFYPADLCIKLKLDNNQCADLLRSKQWVGVELRETGSGHIIGCVVSKAAGYMRLADLKQAPTGIVDYLCVDPRWRGRGLVYVLLRSLYAYCVESDGRYIQFFKKEGGFGLLPPVAHDVYVGRIGTGAKAGARANTDPKKKLDRLTWFNFLETQKMDGGQGQLALINHNPNYETELYTTSYNETTVIYKPTHEYGENETTGRAIVVAWHGHAADYEAALDKIPYDYIYAPSSFPHNRPQWTVQGAIGLYIFHADPGIPYSRPLYSQLTA
jgi:hypothetical protein